MKNSQFIQNHSPLYIQLEGLEKAMKKNLTHFETQSILLNGIIPFFWSEPNETALSAFAKTLPAEKNRIQSREDHISSVRHSAKRTSVIYGHPLL
jgi:hypothetical protein